MRRFEGRNVIVTGGSSGIGRAIVHAFVEEGALVVAVGRDAVRLERVRAEASEPRRVRTTIADLSVPHEGGRMVREATADLGRLHVLVNNAGIAVAEPVLDIRETSWRETLEVNLTAAFFASQEAARHMVSAGGGAIVNVASIDAFSAESPQAHYNVSKAGLVMMTRSFAVELGHLGVRCNCVAPGLTATPMLGDDLEREGFRQGYLRRIPARRPAEPEEPARVVLFLASEDASYVNGETVVVDGGQLAGFWYETADEPPVPG